MLVTDNAYKKKYDGIRQIWQCDNQATVAFDF